MKRFEETYDTASDAELMDLFYDGDNQAFDALAQRVQESLFHQAFYRLPSRQIGRRQIAQDLVQQTLIKAVVTRSRPATRWQCSKGQVRTWLGTILRNLLISYLRTRVSKEPVSSDLARENENATWDSPENELADHRLPRECAARDAESLREQQRAAIDRLPEKVRNILYMKMEGLSHQEIADRLGLSKSTIAYHFREAKTSLRTMVAVAA